MQELEYLRSEMNQRINFSYEHPHKVLGHLLLLWGGTLILFNVKGNLEDIFALFMMATIFFISVIMINFFSKRESENLNQIFRISAYNTIFYEKIPCANKDNKFYWELATFKMMIKEKEDPSKKHNYNLNNEYFICSIIAFGMNFFLLLFSLDKFLTTLDLENIVWLNVLMITLCICYVIASVFFPRKIYENTTLNPNKWFGIKKTI